MICKKCKDDVHYVLNGLCVKCFEKEPKIEKVKDNTEKAINSKLSKG